MAIPAIVWLIVGAGVSIISLKISGLLFFFYIGLIFVAVGIAKLVMRYVFKTKVSKIETKVVTPQLFSVCRHCKSHVRSIDLFCWRCGARVR